MAEKDHEIRLLRERIRKQEGSKAEVAEPDVEDKTGDLKWRWACRGQRLDQYHEVLHWRLFWRSVSSIGQRYMTWRFFGSNEVWICFG